MKQNASFDASFWINLCAGNIVEPVLDYFQLFTPHIVAEEIRYPLTQLNIASKTALLFNEWVDTNKIIIRDPLEPVDWFQRGENSAIALAMETDYFLLMDDANPYHRTKAAGIKVVGSCEFIILLYDHSRLTYEGAQQALRQIQVSKKQRRTALFTLETLYRRKEG